MLRRRIGIRVAIVCLLAIASAACPRETPLDLGRAERVADGVSLYRLTEARALGVDGPIAVQLLRLDPSKVVLQSALAQGRAMALETVPDLAARTRAIAAVNAGFFVVRNGDPAGLLEVGDELVSDSDLARGAVGIVRERGRPARLLFDRVTASMTLRFSAGGAAYDAAVDGVDTTRVRGKLMLYTPSYGPDSDTAPAGVEWQLAGRPPRVTATHADAGKTPIPRDGAVLSYGGTVLPAALEKLTVGQAVSLETTFRTSLGTTPAAWAGAIDIVGGAGLIVHKGAAVTDWSEERLRDGFTTERHPRTMIGTARNGTIWLVTVDGRNPRVSLGMTFADLLRLAKGLNLQYALNLDGGGSTTMVVRGQVMNHPSDVTGPRRVSDALIVTAKN